MASKLIGIERYLFILDLNGNEKKRIQIPECNNIEDFILSIGDEFYKNDGYQLSLEQLKFIASFVEEPIIIKFNSEDYYIITFGIYE